MSLFFITIYCLLVFFIIYTFVKKLNTYFVISFLSFLSLYDWLLINLSYYLPPSFVTLLKCVQEILVVLISVVFICRIIQKHKFKYNKIDKIVFGFVFLCIIGVLMSLISGDDISNIITGMRLYIIPILIPYFFYKYGIFNGINYTYIDSFFKVLILALIIYSLIQILTFDGDLSKLWFYKFYDSLKENPVDKASFNFIRNDRLRATAFFVSSIHMSVISYMISMYFIIRHKKYWLLWTCISIFGIELSSTRIGYLLLLLSIGIFINEKYLKKHSFFFLIPFSGILFTFLSLVFNITSDESALGRLVQYSSFLSNFSVTGRGLGNFFALVFYDSFYISIFIVFGVLGLLYIFYYCKLINIIIDSYNNNKKMMRYSLYISLSALYMFAFQFVAGTFPFCFLFFMLFLSFSELEKDVKV